MAGGAGLGVIALPDGASVVVAGLAVGTVLGVIGGGGSILAVPLLVYFAGIPSTHVAIGTSAVGVAISALANLLGHRRSGAIKWRCALVYSAAGIIGSIAGSTLGKAVDGQYLLAAFGVLMLVVAATMVVKRAQAGDASVRLTAQSASRLVPRLLASGAGTGVLAGFFGIGGGFLIVPGLIAATGMPMRNAAASSLVAVAMFGAATGLSYATAGLIDWPTVTLFIVGGGVGALVGAPIARRLIGSRDRLQLVFAAAVATTGLYIIISAALPPHAGRSTVASHD